MFGKGPGSPHTPIHRKLTMIRELRSISELTVESRNWSHGRGMFRSRIDATGWRPAPRCRSTIRRRKPLVQACSVLGVALRVSIGDPRALNHTAYFIQIPKALIRKSRSWNTSRLARTLSLCGSYLRDRAQLNEHIRPEWADSALTKQHRTTFMARSQMSDFADSSR